MKKYINFGYCFIFLLFLLIPLAMTDTREDVKSNLDNRTLVEFPDVSSEGFEGFKEAVERYLQDRIGLRDQIVTGYQVLNDRLTGELTHPNYIYGQNGYIFFKMHNNIEYSDYHQSFVEAVVKMKNYCEERGASFFFLFEPEKISVYRQYLPIGVNYNDEWVDKLLINLREQGVKVVDNRNHLIEKSKEEQVFNKQYDAGHWNDLGCFYGTNNLLRSIRNEFPLIEEYTNEEFTITNTNAERLEASEFAINEEVPTYRIKTTQWEDCSVQFSSIKLSSRYRFFRHFVNTSEDQDQYPKLLIFHGSYYNRNPQFFIGRAKEYTGIHDYENVFSLDYYFNIFQPDLVVFEAAEYTISDAYFDSTLMKELTYNPGLSTVGGHDKQAAIRNAKSNAENITIEKNIKVYVIDHEGFDYVYLEKELSAAKNIYLFANNEIFDLKRDTNGNISAPIPHGIIDENGVSLYYTDKFGNSYYTEIASEYAESFVKGPNNHVMCSDGVTYDNTQKQIEMNTKGGNVYTSVNMEVIDWNGNKLERIFTLAEEGTYNGNYIHKNETGWYLINLNGNASKLDGSIKVLVYLEKWNQYYYSLEIAKLSKNKIRIKDYDFYGPCPITLKRHELIKTLDISTGIKMKKTGDFKISTDIDGNCFGSVILQLSKSESDEDIHVLSNVNDVGLKKGLYFHRESDGIYKLNLRGNTNKKDEYVSSYISLKENYMYEWTYNVEAFSLSEINIQGFSFKQIGN